MSFSNLRKVFRDKRLVLQLYRRQICSTSAMYKGGSNITEMPNDRDIESKGIDMNMLSQNESDHIYIEKYNHQGFTLNNGLRIRGPAVFFPRSFISWKVKGLEEVHDKSLCLFDILTPKLDLLLLGYGDRGVSVHPSVVKFLREKKINFELLPTEQAISTFNFLNTENRWVCAALVPPQTSVNTFKEDVRTYIKQQKDTGVIDVDADLREGEVQRLFGDAIFDNNTSKLSKTSLIRGLQSPLAGGRDNSETFMISNRGADTDKQSDDVVDFKMPESVYLKINKTKNAVSRDITNKGIVEPKYIAGVKTEDLTASYEDYTNEKINPRPENEEQTTVSFDDIRNRTKDIHAETTKSLDNGEDTENKKPK